MQSQSSFLMLPKHSLSTRSREWQAIPSIFVYRPASASMFSIKIPYPFSGSLTITWVTAPTSFPFWRMGLPLTSDVNMGQQIF